MHILVAGNTGSATAEALLHAGQRAFIAIHELGDSARLVASTERIERELGSKPEHDNLGEMISSAWDRHTSHPSGYQEK